MLQPHSDKMIFVLYVQWEACNLTAVDGGNELRWMKWCGKLHLMFLGCPGGSGSGQHFTHSFFQDSGKLNILSSSKNNYFGLIYQ